ncbi:hypothetical protein PV325_008950 [Microctonus aethiopoides]|uniref:Uncharacterized protein n=1 Tax=Microctonus aethiopoides TaxID=144406 RepID=A0AA39FJF3_9HYME|nr:hypothetical protein PV325_008950 [Microctonus aethiopoides]KAK0074351.1 hypothetical protein PV326_012521 [Microctonus aethiopoides]KAK0170556.1 hypothetical protein PV328_008393 [Microctonus aethiopoides]
MNCNEVALPLITFICDRAYVCEKLEECINVYEVSTEKRLPTSPINSGGHRWKIMESSKVVQMYANGWRCEIISTKAPSRSSTQESGEHKPQFMCSYVRKIVEYDSEPDCIAHRLTVWGSAPLL